MKILITGFEPIWGIKKTPSGELAKLWESKQISVEGVDVTALVLPQLFGESTKIVMSEILSVKPDYVIMYGASQRNEPIRLERFAINVEKSPMGDNSRIPVEEREIVRGGPGRYESTIPVAFLMDEMNQSGVDTKASYHAGTHVCNSVFYGVLHGIKNLPFAPPRVGFVHVSFPNEFGVIEDVLWSTASFSGIVRASVVLVEALKKWNERVYDDGVWK